MADISIYEDSIKNQERGEVVRDAITSAMEAIDENAENTALLEFHPASYYAKKTELRPFVYDEFVTKDSPNLVESNGIFDVVGDAEHPERAYSGTIASRIQNLYESIVDICEAITEKEVPWVIGSPIFEYGNAIRQIYNYLLGPITITKNGNYEPEIKTLWNHVIVNVKKTSVVPITITKNGRYEAPEGVSYQPVVVDVPQPFKVEYDIKKGTGVATYLIGYTKDGTSTTATKNYKEYKEDEFNTSEIYDLMKSQGISVQNIVDNMLGDTDPNKVVSVLTGDGIKLEDTVKYLIPSKISDSDLFTALTNSYDSSGADGVMAMVKNKFNIDSVANAIANSKTNINDVIDSIKNSTSEYLGVDKDELVKKVEELIG